MDKSYPNMIIPWLHRPGGLPLTTTKDYSQQIFTHKEDETGIVRHWHVNTLQEMVKLPRLFRHDKLLTSLAKKQVDFVRNNNGVNDTFLHTISKARLREPGILVMLPDVSYVVVDGNHRMVRRYDTGHLDMLFYTFTLQVAEHALLNIPPEMQKIML